MAFKLAHFSNRMIRGQKIKYFLGYGGGQRLYKRMHRPSKDIFLLYQLLLEKVIENIFLNIFSIFKL